MGQNAPNGATYEGQGNQAPGKDVTCFKCRKVGHYANVCKEDSRVCFNCNKLGHVARDYKAPKVEAGATLNAAGGRRPITAGQVYTLNADEVENTKELAREYASFVRDLVTALL
ncbi:uncharacterized protein LOC130712603 [Lotus japonicus]|uniref:uncharacterized protein LOC130712603 n=1 Tax=Lotus japonicus TaxID=34305 RepID=UPI00258B8E3C|nr:uncharacterized protein LOC130712603 [Lotus japonicus]